MGVQQISDSVIVLEDKFTFQTAFLSGIGLTFVAVIAFLFFPLLNMSALSPWFGVLFVAGDIFFILSARKITIKLDKGERIMTVEKFSIIGKKTFRIPFSRIKHIALVGVSSGHRLSVPVFQVYLEDNKVLSYDYVLDESNDAEALSRIIGIPISDMDAPSKDKWVGFFGSKDSDF